MRRTSGIAVWIALLALAPARGAPAEAEPSSHLAEVVPRTPLRVLLRLHVESQQVIELSALALQRAEDEDVRDLADRLLRDHALFDRRVLDLAARMGVDLEGRAPPPDPLRERADVLWRLHGDEFDRAYADLMVDRNEESLAWLRQARDLTEAKPVQSLADELLPLLEQGAALAEAVRPGGPRDRAG